MKEKATRGQKRMHLLSDLMENRSYTEEKMRSSRQSRLEG